MTTKDIQETFYSEITSGPITEHHLSFTQIQEKFGTSFVPEDPLQSNGLSSEEASKRNIAHGLNIMSPPKSVLPIVKYLICLSNLFNLMLLFAALMSYVLFAIDVEGNFDNIYIASILTAVALANALLEFVQIMKSEAVLKSFLTMVPRKALVTRNGELKEIEAKNIALGDIIAARTGDKLSADMYLFWARGLKVDNSSMTGESDPQERKPGNNHNNPLETQNLAFSGSLVVAGEGYGVVIRIGDNTILGQIADMTSSEKKKESPMTKEINEFVHIIAAFAVTTAMAFFLIGFFTTDISSPDVKVSFFMNFAIGVFIAWVPEGLPAVVTFMLSIAAKRMGDRNVLVKDLKGVETLGAITCLATDKTGTLTRNRMTVTDIWVHNRLINAIQEKSSLCKDGQCYDLLNICLLCSRARYDRVDVPIGQRQILADATETGLFKFSTVVIPDSDNVRNQHSKVFEIPFNSTTKWALVVVKKKHRTGSLVVYIKGAPERVFKLCSWISTEKGISPLENDHKKTFDDAYETLASKGERVIGCAKLELDEFEFPEDFEFFGPDDKEKSPVSGQCGPVPTSNFVFCGLVGLEDPPKHGVREAIGKCRQAGIKVMMVTGDHPLTAEAIGRKINIMLGDTRETLASRTNRNISSVGAHEYNAVVVHGDEIDQFTPNDWESILSKDEIIFARTSPRQKLQIVKALQECGHIVAVTGDGVNDSPALKKADLGISMNISGSDVSKEAATMILLDDNFASTVVGIMEGRLIFRNLKKSIRYTLTHAMPQVLANLLFIVVPLPLPLYPMQIIMVDLGFEVFMGIAYAWEPPENGYDQLMQSLPRKPVSARSIEYFQRKKSYEDLYAGLVEKDGKVITYLKSWFDREAWELAKRSPGSETLVDTDTLSYAYLEVGILEAIGCLVTYFMVFYLTLGWTPSQVRENAYLFQPSGGATEHQLNMLQQAQSAYYFAEMIQQFFNHFMCKAVLSYPFGYHMLANKATWFGLFGAMCLSCFIVYPPFMHNVFNTFILNPLFWTFPLLNGTFIICYCTVRLHMMNKSRKRNENLSLPLDLHPTKFSGTE